jgi:hypothetical protein
VTTGGGFEYSEIEPYTVGAIGDLERMYSLPPNPAGVAKMNAAVKAIARGPAPKPVPALPATARDNSGQTFVFDPNPFFLSFRLDFDGTAEAVLHLPMANEPGPRLIGVGLDGVYRPSHAGRPILARGSWTDTNMFEIDYSEGPGLAAYTFHLQFDGSRMVFDAPGLGKFVANKE